MLGNQVTAAYSHHTQGTHKLASKSLSQLLNSLTTLICIYKIHKVCTQFETATWLQALPVVFLHNLLQAQVA